MFSSTKGAYLSACMHYLAINGPGSTVVGNSYSGGLGAGTARQIQVFHSILYSKKM